MEVPGNKLVSDDELAGLCRFIVNKTVGSNLANKNQG